MSDGTASFEDTLEALESQREAAEGEFNARLAKLEERLGDLLRDLRELEDRGADDSGRAPPTPMQEELRAAADGSELTSGQAVAWPQGSGLRGMLNRLLRWVLGDFLEVLDRRDGASADSLQELNRRTIKLLQKLAEQDALTHAAMERHAGAQAGAVDAVHAALSGAAEAVSLLVEMQRCQLTLMNAKDAEALQRAAHGPLRKMEVMFDEFARQQEALISELVGRRQQLDLLVEKARGGGSDVEGE